MQRAGTLAVQTPRTVGANAAFRVMGDMFLCFNRTAYKHRPLFRR